MTAQPQSVHSPIAPLPADRHVSGAAAKCDKQRTIGRESSVVGVGLVSGADVRLRFLPADADTGYVFIRTDLTNRPRIQACIDNVVARRRRTAVVAHGAKVEMIEHVLAALAGLSIDNCLIEIDADEAPGMDGSARPFTEALLDAGIEVLDVCRRPLVIEDSFSVQEGDAMVAVHPASAGCLHVTFNLDYGNVAARLSQNLSASITPDFFHEQIAPARTFVLESEVAELRKQGLGPRATLRDLLVLDDDGRPIDNELRFSDECVRHKMLDMVGDLALLGRPLRGHAFGHKSGHFHTVSLVRKLARCSREMECNRLLSDKPLLDAAQIEKIIPHRYPFLLVDRVLELDPDRRAVGIKNVSYNEPFFQGHWPGKPIMPGVLILEAMAQLAGIMLTQWQNSSTQYGLIVSMNGIKLRRSVTPGDQLWLEAEAVRVKTRAAVLKTRASVHGELAAEAQFRFVLVDEDTEGL